MSKCESNIPMVAILCQNDLRIETSLMSTGQCDTLPEPDLCRDQARSKSILHVTKCTCSFPSRRLSRSDSDIMHAECVVVDGTHPSRIGTSGDVKSM